MGNTYNQTTYFVLQNRVDMNGMESSCEDCNNYEFNIKMSAIFVL